MLSLTFISVLSHWTRPNPGRHREVNGIAPWQSTCVADARPWVSSSAAATTKRVVVGIGVPFVLCSCLNVNEPV